MGGKLAGDGLRDGAQDREVDAETDLASAGCRKFGIRGPAMISPFDGAAYR